METRVQSNGLFSKPFQYMTKQLESNMLGKFIAHYQWVVTDNNYAIVINSRTTSSIYIQL